MAVELVAILLRKWLRTGSRAAVLIRFPEPTEWNSLFSSEAPPRFQQIHMYQPWCLSHLQSPFLKP